MPLPITGFSHVRLTVTDIDRSRRFYDDVFGLPVAFEMPADADDATKDTFVRAWRSLARFRGESTFPTWLYRIVTRRCFDLLAAHRPTEVLDDDQLGMMATFVRGVDLTENGQALDAIRENGPGQHFLGTAHTLANFENAFYRSTTADNASYEQWLEDGGLDAAQRANAIWKKRLAEYVPPPIDDAVDEELRAFIARIRSRICA